MSRTPRPLTTLAAVALLTLAAGCGDSGVGGPDGTKAPGGTGSPPPSPSREARDEARPGAGAPASSDSEIVNPGKPGPRPSPK